MTKTSIGGARRTAGNILIFLAGLILIGSAVAKFAQVSPVITPLAALGFAGSKLKIIAALEILSALLFLVPATRSVGLLMVSAYMGGAISAHMGHNEPVYQPAFVLALIWIGAWLRHPEFLLRFRPSASVISPFGSPAPDRRRPGFANHLQT